VIEKDFVKKTGWGRGAWYYVGQVMERGKAIPRRGTVLIT